MYENVLCVYAPIVLVQLCDDANELRKSSARQIREYTVLSRQISFSDLLLSFARQA